MEQKRFYYPGQLFSGDHCIEKLKLFISPSDIVFFITDSSLKKIGVADQVEEILKQINCSIVEFTGVMPNPEVEMIYRATELAKNSGATAVVAVGGGSVMDAAKTVAMLCRQPGPMVEYAERGVSPEVPSLPCYAVPTTCGTGSEGSSVAVVSYGEKGKRGLWSDNLFVNAAFLDVDLMMGLPASITATTAMDAIDHAIEAYIGLDRQPILDAFALHAVRLIYKYLPIAYETGDRYARDQLSAAAFMAGIAMGQSGTGIVHSMADRLGEVYHTPHGLGIAILLPPCLRYNAPAVLDRLADLAGAMELDISGKSVEEAAYLAVDAVESLVRRVGIPQRVSGEMVSAEKLREMAETSVHHFITDNNPIRPSTEDLMNIFLQVLPEDHVK